MNLIDLSEIVNRWQTVKQDAGIIPSCCILASKVLMIELLDAGAEVWVEPTYAIASNRWAWPHVGRTNVADWPPEAWSVGIDPEGLIGDGGGYPGHLVVMVELGDGGLVLVDGSAGQFARPAKQMTIPPTLIVPANDWPDGAVVQRGDWRVDYMPAPLGQQHRVAPDWRRNWRDLAASMRKTRA